MKSMILVALALVAVVAAAPVDEVAQIVDFENVQQPDGSYLFRYKSTDGSERREEGLVKEVLDADNKPQAVVVVRGSYIYLQDGKPVQVTYSADENGFSAEGDTIVKPARR